MCNTMMEAQHERRRLVIVKNRASYAQPVQPQGLFSLTGYRQCLLVDPYPVNDASM